MAAMSTHIMATASRHRPKKRPLPRLPKLHLRMSPLLKSAKKSYDSRTESIVVKLSIRVQPPPTIEHGQASPLALLVCRRYRYDAPDACSGRHMTGNNAICI